MRTTRKVMSVENRSRSEWAASAKRPRLPDNKPTRSLRAARLPLATIEAVVTASFELVCESFPTIPICVARSEYSKLGIKICRKTLCRVWIPTFSPCLNVRRPEAQTCLPWHFKETLRRRSHVVRNWEKFGLREVLGRKSLTQSLIEQFAPQQPLLKLVVEYKRRGKQLRRVESIIKAIRRGRVYPLFSQTRDGRISSTDPDLFADDGLERLCDCIGGEPAVWLQDKRRSLDQVQQASGDLTLKRDRTGPGQLNLFMKGQAIMDGVDHDELLLRVLIGESSHRLSTRFLVDRLTVNNIVHVLGARYPRVFHYVADARAQGLKQGYVERDGLRRYFDGFGSSSMEKRNIAQVLACRWLLQY
jgi:hypothetical protein